MGVCTLQGAPSIRRGVCPAGILICRVLLQHEVTSQVPGMQLRHRGTSSFSVIDVCCGRAQFTLVCILYGTKNNVLLPLGKRYIFVYSVIDVLVTSMNYSWQILLLRGAKMVEDERTAQDVSFPLSLTWVLRLHFAKLQPAC